MKEFDVVGLGNVLVDVLVKTDENLIENFGLKKGIFNPVDSKMIETIESKIKDLNPKIIPAGSCPNTIMGIANLEGKCALIGKVGKDSHGKFYEDFLKSVGVTPYLSSTKENPTGKCICLITSDAQRTMAANLGAANNLQKEDVNIDCIKKSKIFHLTGYELEHPEVRKAALHALDIAKDSGSTISIDLADPETIKRLENVLKKIVFDYADIIFANEIEAKVFSGENDTYSALNFLSSNAETIVLKVGEKGSILKSKGKTFEIPIYPTKAIDTTGAGDLYASGFLWAFAKNKPLEICGKTGSFVASRIVSQIGAVLETSLANDIKTISE